MKKCSKSVQTSPPPITKDDLVSEENDKHYWQQLAEKRQEVLDDSLSEIERLKEDISILKEENSICNEMLNESMHLVEVLKVRFFSVMLNIFKIVHLRCYLRIKNDLTLQKRELLNYIDIFPIQQS